MKHYQKARRDGDFPRESPCSVEGCGNLARALKLCDKHYERQRSQGSPAPQKPWLDLPPHLKWCTGCRAALPRENFGGKSSFCRPCTAAYMRERRKLKPAPSTPKQSKACEGCGEEFQADKKRSKYCTPACSAEAKKRYDLEFQKSRPESRKETGRRYRQNHPEKNREKSRVYRARKFTTAVEQLDETAIFERDQWTCQICLLPIDPKLRGTRRKPHPLSKSIDHRIPLVRGGEHSMANCQAAHLICNIRKGDSLTP